ncbi:retinoid-inducible serine carboxypeptidase-like isoform X2 [Anthonomus grandis grandis]|uniref:retinoid-inducible serine carboxypeptidase-like isoform X2 n=1 Tax=Anthonomus grandis grandis TaxID=2921223 RepID=UPI0021660503|nr:retinoid-inducible serine carboxypeptidase-like isoform X2 [Anthonomus grandis grandis]
MKILLIFLFFFVAVLARKGFGDNEQEWGYVEVRKGAYMFWWLHYTTATPDYTKRPLIIWLQGGPGGSSTAYGNFEELGPLDKNLKPRHTTWIQHANILFVDNPVGTGFSYVTTGKFATTNEQIAVDFSELLRSFYKALPKFQDVPLYIFSESYGGKMTAEIALHIHEAVQKKTLNVHLKGIGLGDAYISPLDSTISMASYLYNMGFLDTNEYHKLELLGNKVKDLLTQKQWEAAFSANEKLALAIRDFTRNVDVYNVLTRKGTVVDESCAFCSLKHIMDNVKLSLNLSSEFCSQAVKVYRTLINDFMKPVTHIVERLLNETDITVAVYNGQLDLIVDTLGVIQWLDKLHFKAMKDWKDSPKTAFIVNGVVEGFEKKAGNLIFYSVLRSGHMLNPRPLEMMTLALRCYSFAAR